MKSKVLESRTMMIVMVWSLVRLGNHGTDNRSREALLKELNSSGEPIYSNYESNEKQHIPFKRLTCVTQDVFP